MALDSGALLASVRNGLAINAIFLALTRLTLPLRHDMQVLARSVF